MVKQYCRVKIPYVKVSLKRTFSKFLNRVERRSVGFVLEGGTGDGEWRTALFGFVLRLPPERTPSRMILSEQNTVRK